MTNRFEEKAQAIAERLACDIIDGVMGKSSISNAAVNKCVSAISTALEAAYQEGRESEAAMNELVKIGQEIETDAPDV